MNPFAYEMMIAVLIILGILFSLVVFLIFTPIVLKIDSYNNQYYIQVWGIAKCSFLWRDGIVMEVKMPFRKFYINPFAPTGKKEKKKSKPKPKRKRKKRSGKGSLKIMLSVLRSFKVKKFSLDIDTSDMIWNAYLYPVFFFLNSEKAHLNINYTGQVGILIHLENRLSRIIWVFIKHKLFTNH
jgi:hypothetical protein